MNNIFGMIGKKEEEEADVLAPNIKEMKSGSTIDGNSIHPKKRINLKSRV